MGRQRERQARWSAGHYLLRRPEFSGFPIDGVCEGRTGEFDESGAQPVAASARLAGGCVPIEGELKCRSRARAFCEAHIKLWPTQKGLATALSPMFPSRWMW